MSAKTDIISHLRNLPEDDTLLADVEDMIAGFRPPYVAGSLKPVMEKPHEEQWVDGAINPGFLVELRDIAINYNIQWQNYYGHQWPAFKTQIDAVNQMAKQAGIDLASYAPEVLSLSDLKDKDSVFEATEDQVRKLADRIETSHEIALRNLPDAKKKRWAKTLRKVCQLQQWCRSPRPKGKRLSTDQQEVWDYLHPLRFMLYCNRSHLMSDAGDLQLVEIPVHLILACMILKCAELHAAELGIDGALLIIPPRHGKTTLGCADMALDICLHGHVNNGIVHHNSDHARRRLLAVRDYFDDNLDVGRRRRALFPDIRRDPSVKSNSLFFTLYNGKRQNIHQEGNASSWGIHSQAQGLTFHKLMLDDPSDQKEQAEQGTRERTNAAISSTWIPRLTGRGSFFKYICTRWHPEDFSGVLLGLVKQGVSNVAYYSLACGGPDSDFEPIWPEAGYDRTYLRAAYARLGPAQYSCQYQNNPDSPESRRGKRLVCFDEREYTDETFRTPSYRRFFDDLNSVYYLSVDPTGSSSKYANLAGITYAVYGLFRQEEEDKSTLDIPLLLFLKYWSIHAGQHELAQIISTFYDNNRVDKVLVETTGGFHATSEALEVVHHIPAAKVIRVPPGVGIKHDRLLKYAIHLESGDAQFPGEWVTAEHGEPALQLSSNWGEMATQLLQSGTAKDDNLLDCVRQQLAEVSPNIYAAKHLTPPEETHAKPSQRAKFFEDAIRTKKERIANQRRLRNHLLFRRIPSGNQFTA
jgi:hypothetical protein